MATNKDKEKELEQLQEQGQEQETNTSTTPDPIEEAQRQAQAILEAAKEQEAKIVEAAKEQADKIKYIALVEAEAAARHDPLGPKGDIGIKGPEANDPMEELVDYIAPLIVGKEDQPIFVQVNGENIRIQRGKKVRIKRKFKEVLDQSAEQEMAAYAFMEKVQRDSAKAAADLN